MAIEKLPHTYALASAVQIWPLDVSAREPRYLVEVEQERRFEISSGIHDVIQLLRDGRRTAEEIAQELQERGFEDATPERISRLIRKVLIPRRIVEAPAGEPVEDHQASKKRSSYLRVKIPLVGAETLRPITAALRLLFNTRIFIVALSIGAVAHFYFYTQIFVDFEWAAINLPLVDYAFLLLLMNLAAITHELGHATACRYYGCPHGKIGWGIYIFMLVLYTDVSPAWRLKRRQRAVVDCAGMYFELIAASFVLGLYLLTSKPLFAYLFLLLDLSILNSLNPVLRRDGYWLLSDLAGQANLRDANLEILQSWWTRLFRGGKAKQPERPSIPRWLRVTIQLYSVATVIFSALFVFWILRRITSEIIPGVPMLLQRIADSLSAEPMAYMGALDGALRLLFYSIFVLFIAIAAWKFVSPLVHWLRGADANHQASA